MKTSSIIIWSLSIIASTTSYGAINLYSVAWSSDAIADGVASGTFNFPSPVSVAFSSTNGSDGNVFDGADWATLAQSNDVPGINSGNMSDTDVVVNAAANNVVNTLSFTFSEAIVDPILITGFTTASSSLSINEITSLSDMSLIDDNAASASLSGSNIVNFGGGNNGDSGFSLQLSGSFTQLTVNYQQNSGSAANMVMTIAAVPEPAAAGSLFGLVALSYYLLRRRRSA